MELRSNTLRFALWIASIRLRNCYFALQKDLAYISCHSEGIYTIPPHINPLAVDLITRMLQVDPYKRIRIY